MRLQTCTHWIRLDFHFLARHTVFPGTSPTGHACTAGHCDAQRDFVGHIGGDDFIVLFQSADWERRCRAILSTFSEASRSCFSNEDRLRGSILSEDRQGRAVRHPLTTLSIGAVRVEPGQNLSHHQIASAASLAKGEAKKIAGNSLFIERRQL